MAIKLKARVKKGFWVTLGCLMLFFAIGFVEKQQMDKVCNKIVVQIDNQADNYFISEQDIVSLATDGGRDYVIGKNLEQIRLKEIENRIKLNKFVEDAEVYNDLKGNLIVKAHQSQPIARVINSSGPDAYIDKEGKILPVSERFTARVILIGGDYSKKLVQKDLYKSEEGGALLNMLYFIRGDEFWRAQISEIYVDENLEITLYPQVSRQVIEFGKPEDIENKFKKLKIFYKEILPQRGWNKYEKVNLKYHNQIVCE